MFWRLEITKYRPKIIFSRKQVFDPETRFYSQIMHNELSYLPLMFLLLYNMFTDQVWFTFVEN